MEAPSAAKEVQHEIFLRREKIRLFIGMLNDLHKLCTTELAEIQRQETHGVEQYVEAADAAILMALERQKLLGRMAEANMQIVGDLIKTKKKLTELETSDYDADDEATRDGSSALSPEWHTSACEEEQCWCTQQVAIPGNRRINAEQP